MLYTRAHGGYTWGMQLHATGILLIINDACLVNRGRPRFTVQVRDPMLSMALLTIAALCATACAQDTYRCNALAYAQPGFVSDRRLYPPDNHDPRVWDGMHKVAFQKSDCTWLAANFKDTGSSFVAVLFAGFTQHKVSASPSAFSTSSVSKPHDIDAEHLLDHRRTGRSLR